MIPSIPLGTYAGLPGYPDWGWGRGTSQTEKQQSEPLPKESRIENPSLSEKKSAQDMHRRLPSH
jgi:hypothetical protein